MNVNAHDRFLMQNYLRQAIERNELQLHYQPQVDLSSGHITGAEALLRWNSAELGSVPPARFIPVAEDSGLIIPIGEWVLREACKQAEAWRQQGLPPLTVAVNMSPLQFKRSDPVALVRQILEETCLPAWCLELEITESLLIHDMDAVLGTLQDLTTLGVRIAIDDFGTGYSSFSYLKRFPIDKLKVDQSFVRDIVTDADDAAIVRVIIELGRILKMKTIAEGVETSQQLAFLTQQGCGHVQGYLFGKPMPAGEFAAHLREENEEPSGRKST
jgi:EAL domain-containing protein (putative c-di-GMP-specific phosphodiesterase class I)